jgi:hypothetical protein
VHHIKEVPRVLSVQRSTELPGIEIRRVEALDLDEELVGFLRCRAQFACDRRYQAAADDDAGLYLDARTRFFDKQLSSTLSD